MLEDNKWVLRTGILTCIKKGIEVANIQTHAKVDTLRHSYATQIIQSGVDIKIVQEMLIHASLKTKEFYT